MRNGSQVTVRLPALSVFDYVLVRFHPEKCVFASLKFTTPRHEKVVALRIEQLLHSVSVLWSKRREAEVDLLRTSVFGSFAIIRAAFKAVLLVSAKSQYHIFGVTV